MNTERSGADLPLHEMYDAVRLTADRELRRNFLEASLGLPIETEKTFCAAGFRTVEQLLAASGRLDHFETFPPRDHRYELSEALLEYGQSLAPHVFEAVVFRGAEQSDFWNSLEERPRLATDFVLLGVTTETSLQQLAYGDPGFVTQFSARRNVDVVFDAPIETKVGFIRPTLLIPN